MNANEIIEIARSKLGQEYVYGAQVPLDNSDWTGPWDCAEYCSWAIYQTIESIYGARIKAGQTVADAEAWTGHWVTDLNKFGIRVSVDVARRVPGSFLLRRNPNGGHVVMCVGDGNTTLEARGSAYGVVEHVIEGRDWNYGGILIPDLEYPAYATPARSGFTPAYEALPNIPRHLRTYNNSILKGTSIKKLQNVLSERGLYKGQSTGKYDSQTAESVKKFQIESGITVDATVGPEVVEKLKIKIDFRDIKSVPKIKTGK